MTRGCISLTAASHLVPFQQGEGSELCGLYSVLNGIQLALWPDRKLSQAQLKRLIRLGADSASLGLLDVLGRGIDEEPWLELAREMLEAASDLTGQRIRPHYFLRGRARSRTETALRAIQRQIAAQRPVIVMLWGGYNHATVISGVSPRRVELFDSIGFKWVKRSSLGLDHAWSTKLHRIPKRSAMALVRTDSTEW